MMLWLSRTFYAASIIALIIIGDLPPEKLYPDTHLREALVFGIVSFSAITALCIMIQHHRLGEAAFTIVDNEKWCLTVGVDVGSVVAMYNLRHDRFNVWWSSQRDGGKSSRVQR